MKGDWEEIPREDGPSWAAGPHVTLNKRGHIAFNRRAHELIGKPEAVLLLFDRINNRIGIRAANPGLRNAYKVKKTGRPGSRLVHAYRLLAKKGIDVPETLQFPDARIDEDQILILDLRTGGSQTDISARHGGLESRSQNCRHKRAAGNIYMSQPKNSRLVSELDAAVDAYGRTIFVEAWDDSTGKPKVWYQYSNRNVLMKHERRTAGIIVTRIGKTRYVKSKAQDR